MENSLPPPSPDAPILPPTGTPEEKQWILITHLSGLAGLVIPFAGNILGPLVVWILKKEEFPKIDTVGRNVLNFQISYTIYLVVASATMFFCVGFILLPVVAIAWLVFLILGAVKASKGEDYNFPLTIKML